MKKTCIFILGAGGMGQRHAKAFAQTGRCEVYCFDENPAAVERIKAGISVAGVLTNIGDIPKGLVTGAVIATPTNTHLDYAKWCVDNAIPFMVEKPIATSDTGWEELITLCKAGNILSGVAFPRRSSFAIRRIKEKIDQGALGELKMIRCNFSQDFRKYRPDYQSTYYAKLSTGGGAIMDALSHHINLACYFGGTVQSVSAFYDRLIFEGVEAEDCALINLRFRNGILASINGNQFQKPNEDFIELIGTAGNIKYERLAGKLSSNSSDSVAWQEEDVDGDWSEIVQAQACGFLDAIAGNGTLKTSLEEGLHHLRIVLAARLSQEKGNVIEVPQ